MFLVYGGNPKVELRVDCYCNAGFETDRDDIKSQMGYVFVLNGGAVDWKSFKQSTTAMSATEVEYIVASEAAMKVSVCSFSPLADSSTQHQRGGLPKLQSKFNEAINREL
ncbi:hypothetical protein Tco_0015064 [Tanacetum coccineum]